MKEALIVTQLIDYKTAASRLGVPIATVYSMLSLGKIPHIRLGPRLVRFDPVDLDNFVSQSREGARISSQTVTD